MKFGISTALAAVAMMSCASVNAADLKSGLQVDEYPGAYYVADVTGPSAGKKLCYRCQYGARPVVNIFARKMDANVAKLIKELDAVVGKHKDEKRMAGFVVMLTDDPDAAESALKETAQKHEISNIPLTVFENTVGPASYKINPEADVTVMMWVDSKVAVNHAFTQDQVNSDVITKVVDETGKILN